ncbi:ER membrane protein complex subunit 7 [Trichinella sp. T8]|nr:ER membrane protein complex subunit 7 [Trichinella sp. T8]
MKTACNDTSINCSPALHIMMKGPLADAGGVQHHVLPIPGYAGGGAPCAAPRSIDALTDMHVDDLVKNALRNLPPEDLSLADEGRVLHALLSIPRDQVRHSEMQVFGDASEAAFVSVAYLMTESMGVVKEWLHYPMTDNPADKFSSGCDLEKLIEDHFWWNGPAWLRESEDQWPPTKVPLSLEEIRLTSPEQKLITVLVTTVQRPGIQNIIDPGKHSKMERLGRITAYCVRFEKNRSLFYYLMLITQNDTINNNRSHLLFININTDWFLKYCTQLTVFTDKCCTTYDKHRLHYFYGFTKCNLNLAIIQYTKFLKECICSNLNAAGSGYSSANGLPLCYKIEGRVYPNWKLKESETDWRTSTRILVNFGQYIGLIKSDGTFVVHCVPSGSYVVEVANADVIFEPYRVEINARGKIRARKLNYVQPAIVYAVPYPLKFAANSTVRYFRPREQWRIVDFLLNPMVLMMLMSLFIIVVFPKLNSVTDPEIQREMQQTMSMPSYDLPELSELMANWVVGKKKASRSKNLKLKR